MGSRAAYDAIAQHWQAGWPHTPTATGNATFEPTPGQPWVRLSVLDGASRQVSVGTPTGGGVLDRSDGVIAIQIFTPDDQGEAQGRWLADAACILLRRKSLAGGITTRVPSVIVVGNEGAWHQINVTCPFWRDELAA